MDISKASNFERFVFDLVGRDPAVVRELWSKVDAGGSFDLSATPYFSELPKFGFVSSKSVHADRLATIRHAYEHYGVMLDTHTADGLKVALEHRAKGMSTLVLETALPAKFEETIVEALGPRVFPIVFDPFISPRRGARCGGGQYGCSWPFETCCAVS